MSVQIVFDNYDGTCYPGQTLSGRIECFLREVKTIRAIRIKFEGKANTEWTESERYYDDVHKEERTRDVNYTAKEIYFQQEYNLNGGGGSELKLPPGKHTYPFSYILPQQLPSSFEHTWGSVRYTIKATVDCPWQFDLDSKVILNVVSLLDLNFVPRVQEPVQISVDKTMCSCWCNDTGALTFNISLPVTGYTPGQDVRIGAYLENMTNVSAENVKFKISKSTEFIAEFPSRSTQYTSDVIASCSEGGVGAHGEKSWTSVLTIPTDRQFPNMIPCNIINIRYILEAEVVVPCPHTNLSTEIPLKIGNIPLAHVNTSIPLGPPQETNGYPPYPNATAPPLEEGNPPYPAGSAGDAPYPPTGMPYPPTTAGWTLPEPSKSSAPPSYEEAQQLVNKDGGESK